MKRIGIAGATLCLGLLSAPSWAQLQPNAPWPAFGKDYQNSRSTTLGAPTNGSVRWTYNAGSRSFSSPIVAADGAIYFGATDGIHAVRPNGQRRWRWSAGYSAATSTPAIDANGVVYALVNPSDAILVALNGSTGALLWSLYLGGSNVLASPAIGPDGRIYVTNGEVPGGYLYCINTDGTIAWRLYLGMEANSTPCFGSDGAISQWMAPLAGVMEGGVAHTPTRVYFTSNNRELRAYTHTGALQWRHRGNYRASTPAVGADGIVYAVGNLGGAVYAVNPANGLVRWSTSIGTANWYASPAIGGDGTVYVVNGDGRLYAFGPLGGFLWAGGDVDGWDGDYSGTTAVVQFYQDDELKYEMVAPVNPDGTVELHDTPVGVHDIKVRIHNSLFGRVPSVALEVDQPAAIQVRLLNGDVNADNIVDDADLLYILMHYGQHAPDYDLNGDALIDDADLLIVLFNFGAIGE